MNKSLLIKWNKAGQQILSDVQKDKHKTNAEGVRRARRRGQMVAARQETEKYPLAAKLVVAEFKLRRAKGSKVSKL